MRLCNRYGWTLPLLLLATMVLPAFAQVPGPLGTTDVGRLQQLQDDFAQQNAVQRTALFQQLIAEDSGAMGLINSDPDMQLMGIDSRGRLLVNMVENLDAAISIGTDLLWPGGASGLNLDGANLPGQMAVWDGSAVYAVHQEFGGRATPGDGAVTVGYHSTHVAGTMMASGVNPAAKGMSPAALLDFYDWTDDEIEMAAAAAGGLRVSNHSYGYGTGWYWSSSGGYWIWYGDHTVSATEDAGFGFYYDNARDLDDITYNAPYYLVCKSAGNDRNDAGPAAGEYYWYWNPLLSDWEWINIPRDPDGGTTGFHTISYAGNAKNILTVGATYDVIGGYSTPGGVISVEFSSWGPTDDGRIKPDISANGVGLYSAWDTGPADYYSISGTSMSSPNASGSANLLFGHYLDTHGTNARSATVKGLILHTANETGTADGPDYSFGWGLMDTHGAAQVITGDAATGNRILETSLADGGTNDLVFYSDGLEPIALTVCWTDPAGTVPVWSLNPPDLMLVNDLDLRLERLSDAMVYEPWILDPANPANAATTGDNFRDNVERIDVAAPTAGWYRVRVTHKGTLAGGGQIYSFIQSGLRQVLHVAVTGDDANPGTVTAPLANLWVASYALMGEGEIVIHDGVHSSGGSIMFGEGVDLHGATGSAADVHIVGGTMVFDGTTNHLADLTIRDAVGSNVHARYGANLTVEGCVLRGAGDHGVFVMDATALLRDCTVVSNTVNGVDAYNYSNIMIERTIIALNGGVAAGTSVQGDVITLVCCDLYGNTGGDWVGAIAPQVNLDGNFSADPCFCDIGAGDFHVASDSWALAGHHPWGCDDLIGALGVGCGDAGCAGVVPTLVPTLDARLSGHQVELTWTSDRETDPQVFRVVRRLDGELSELTVVATANGFRAVDSGIIGAAGHTAFYSLLHLEHGEWTVIMEKSLELDLPLLVTRLEGARPNPFNPSTEISFTLAAPQQVELAIYDITGRRIALIADTIFPAGSSAVTWHGTDSAGRGVSSGTYFARMVTSEGVQTTKLLLVQ